MEEVFRFADELGPVRIVHVYVPSAGLKGVLVVDNVAAGPSIGGLRIAPDVSTAECFRLARSMTLKNAAAGLPHGGGKSVVYGDPRAPLPKKERLVRAMACALGDIDDYIFGPDMGTDETCMAWVKSEIGRAVGLPRELGGIPLDELGATGWGVAHATEVALRFRNFGLQGARFAMEGFGSVGQHAARFLCARGAILVAASDSRGASVASEGLDLEALLELKHAGRSVIEYPEGKPLHRDELIDVECDIWIPAARPDSIREDNQARLKARLVVSGANIPITSGAEELLHRRGVLCVPDFIANAGGVICAAMEYRGTTQAAAFESIEEKVRSNTEQVLEEAQRRGVLPRQAAVDLSLRRVKRAMATRRWEIF